MDLVTIKNKLIQRKTLETVGGIEYVVELANFLPAVSGAVKYAKIVADCSRRRKMIKGCEIAVTGLYDRGNIISKIADYMQAEILGENVKPTRLKSIGDSCVDLINVLEQRQKEGLTMPGISTGYWNERKRPSCERSSGERARRSLPPRVAEPPVTVKRGSPARTPDSVLLPEPLGPIMACTSPGRIVRSMPRSISLPSMPARRLLTFSSSSLIVSYC